MRMRMSLLTTVAAGSLALLAASWPGQARAEDPIIIGAAIAQSGAIAPYDEGPARAMEVAIDEINAKGGLLGRQIKIVYSDTKSDIAYGSTAAQQVIDQGAALVVVTCDYDYGSAAATVAVDKGLIAFSTCAGDPKFGPQGIGPNAFTMATGAPGQAVAMAEWAFEKQGWKTAYILMDTTIAFDATWCGTFKKRWAELAGAGGLLGEDTFGGEDPQIASQITRLKALPTPPDVYFVTYASVFGNDPRAPMIDFMKKYEAKAGARAVTSHAVTGYSLIEAWSKAVTEAGSLEADKVREKLEAFNNVPLLAGPTSFSKDAHINMQRDLVLMKVDGGKTGNIVGIFAARQMPE